MRLGSATTKLLPILIMFASTAFPNPLFINPAFADGQEVSGQYPAVLDFTSMGAAGSGVAAFTSVEAGLPIGFSDVATGQDYQFQQAGIGIVAPGLSAYMASAPILIDYVAVPNFDFSQIQQQGQITAVTLDYESVAPALDRAFTFEYAWSDPSAVPEPATIGLGAIGLGVFAAAFFVRRRGTLPKTRQASSSEA
jgi:hypothetical protein